MVFDATVTLGNVVTAASVVIALSTLVFTLRKDRRVREREVADRARESASEALTGLLEWRENAIRFYLSLDSYFINASRLLLSGPGNREEARDLLWKSLMDKHENFTGLSLDGGPISKFAGLLAYEPSTYSALSNLLVALRSAERESFLELVETSQQTILQAPVDLGPAPIDNQLRRDCLWHQGRLSTLLEERSSAAEELLKSIILLSDRDLLRRKRLPEKINKFINATQS